MVQMEDMVWKETYNFLIVENVFHIVVFVVVGRIVYLLHIVCKEVNKILTNANIAKLSLKITVPIWQ